MKLHPSQRSALAERICRRWIARRGIRLAVPAVYLVRMKNYGSSVAGTCYWYRGIITLRVGPRASRRDQYILLAHEFSHYIQHRAKGRSGRRSSTHGELFQLILWRTVPRGLWKRASQGHWVLGSSAHDPKYQYTTEVEQEQAA